MLRDLMRSLGGGTPWLLMEQAPSAVNWRPRNAAKRSRADAGLVVPVRRRVAPTASCSSSGGSRPSGAEKFHSGTACRTPARTRGVFREVEQLGRELTQLSALEGDAAIVGTRVTSSIAIVFDWTSWWAIEQPAAADRGLLPADALRLAFRHLVRSASPSTSFRPEADLSAYDLVVVPAHFALTDAQGANLAAFAEGGGTLVTGFGTGITDENLHVHPGGYLGEPLRRTLGIWIEEFAPPAGADLEALGVGDAPAVPLQGDVLGGTADGHVWAEFVRVTDADTLATFTDGALAGWPAITRRAAGQGSAWYVATLPEPAALAQLAAQIISQAGIDMPAPVAEGGDVEAVRRGGALFVINHGADEAELLVDGTDLLTGAAASGLRLPSQGVAIVVDAVTERAGG